MRYLKFTEAGFHTNVQLTTSQARWLIDQGVAQVQPSYAPGCFDIRIGNITGIISFGDLSISISPKLPVGSVLWMLNYTSFNISWRDEPVLLKEYDLTEAMVSLLCLLIKKATDPGLLSGYWREDASLSFLRGRIRLPDQLNRHYGSLYPLELSYDEYGNNILENRILVSALLEAQRLLSGRAVPSTLQARISALLPRFADVKTIMTGNGIPPYRLTAVNARYHAALRVAELFLNRRGFDTEIGTQHARGFLIDMPNLFERFVVKALRDQMPDATVNAQHSTRFVRGSKSFSSHLVRPDIVVTENAQVRLAMDTKYKKARPTMGDLYQLNAYADTLGLDEVTLIYGEDVPDGETLLTQAGKRIHIKGIDLSAPPEEVLRQISHLTD